MEDLLPSTSGSRDLAPFFLLSLVVFSGDDAGDDCFVILLLTEASALCFEGVVVDFDFLDDFLGEEAVTFFFSLSLVDFFGFFTLDFDDFSGTFSREPSGRGFLDNFDFFAFFDSSSSRFRSCHSRS